MELSTPSHNLLNLEGTDLIGKTLVGHPTQGRPRTLGRIKSVTDHSQTTVIRIEKNGSESAIALDRAAWTQTEEADLVDQNPTSDEMPKKYVRFTTKPSMPAVQVS